MSHSVRRHLRLAIDAYDATIRRWIPGYETMLAVAAEAVAAVRPARVLDLGSGTGALAEALLGHPEVGSVELVDVDPEMLAQARIRLAGAGGRAVFTEASFDHRLAPCDAVAASLSLHHIPTLDAKALVFGHVYEAVAPGGVFVNADVTMPADDDGRREAFRYWAAHMAGHGIGEEQAYAHFEEWADEDAYLPLEAELAALRRLGFEAEQVWSAGPLGVVVARKPED